MFADFSSSSQSHLQPQRCCREVLTHVVYFLRLRGLYDFSSRSHSKFQSTLKSEPMNPSIASSFKCQQMIFIQKNLEGFLGLVFLLCWVFFLLRRFNQKHRYPSIFIFWVGPKVICIFTMYIMFYYIILWKGVVLLTPSPSVCLFCGLDGIERTLEISKELALSPSMQAQTYALLKFFFPLEKSSVPIRWTTYFHSKYGN